MRNIRHGGEQPRPAGLARAGRMEDGLIASLSECRSRLAAVWTRAALAAPRDNPLAVPEALVLLVEPALDRLVQRLLKSAASRPEGRVIRGQSTWPPQCSCGRNPYLQFYVRGEEAMVAEMTSLETFSSAQVAFMRDQFRIIALEDIRLFGGVCMMGVPGPTAQSG